MYAFGFHLLSIMLLLCGRTIALPYAPESVNMHRDLSVKSARTADTCADPTLAHTIYQSFIPQRAFHGLDFGPTCESADSGNRVLICADRQPKFLAWPTQQNFTVPLFKLSTANGAQIIYRTGTDAQTPPTVSGFTGAPLLLAWVYNSQVCGSVPLMSTLLASVSDRLYTTDTWEHDQLVSDGWTDNGVVAFVLPLDYS